MIDCCIGHQVQHFAVKIIKIIYLLKHFLNFGFGKLPRVSLTMTARVVWLDGKVTKVAGRSVYIHVASISIRI